MAHPKHRLWQLLLAVVLLSLAAGLRFSNLEGNPPGFWQDEASTGLDAWLLWHTGKDQSGAFLPLISKSFGDFPLAGYRYLAAPFVGILGPTPGHERLPAAIFGTLMVFAAGALMALRFGRWVGLCALLTGALAPTWLHFSRYGSEAILLPASLTLGWLLMEYAREREKYSFLIVGSVSLAFSAYTYHAVKLFLPLWMLAYLIYWYPFLKKGLQDSSLRKYILAAAAVFACLVLPSVLLAFSGDGQSRGRMVLAIYQRRGMDIPFTILNNYLSYFDPGMLFVRGGPAVAQSIPGLGLWNLMELPLMGLGFWVLFKDSSKRRLAGFLLAWFLLGPLPGGVTYEAQNVGRAIGWLPVPQMISAVGMGWLLNYLWGLELSAKKFALAAFLIVGWSFTTYVVWRNTLKRYPLQAEREFQFEITRALDCAKQKLEDGEQIVVSPRFHMGPLFARFHLAEYGDDALGQKPIWSQQFRQIVKKGELYIATHDEKPRLAEPVCQVRHTPSNRVLARVYRYQPQQKRGPMIPAKPLEKTKVQLPQGGGTDAKKAP